MNCFWYSVLYVLPWVCEGEKWGYEVVLHVSFMFYHITELKLPFSLPFEPLPLLFLVVFGHLTSALLYNIFSFLLHQDFFSSLKKHVFSTHLILIHLNCLLPPTLPPFFILCSSFILYSHPPSLPLHQHPSILTLPISSLLPRGALITCS